MQKHSEHFIEIAKAEYTKEPIPRLKKENAITVRQF